MPSLTDLAYTKNWSASKQPFLTDLETALDEIQTDINDDCHDNIVQLALDAYGSSYALDSDGLAQYTNNLYDKITATDTYTVGNITISTTAAWTDVDTTNAAIAFTPEIAGDFRVTFQFTVDIVSSNATNEADVRFRLTDGTTNSDFTPRIRLVSINNAQRVDTPVSLSYVFDSLAAAAQTVKLQYYITTSTNMTIIVMANTNDALCMKSEKI